MRRLLIVLVVLAALLVAADRVGVVVAQNRLASQIQQQLNLDRKPDVSIRGIPFLTQAISGTYKDIRVQLPDVDAGDVQNVAIDARLQGTHVPLSDAVGGNVGQIPVDRISGTLLIPYDELAKASGISGLTEILLGPVGGDEHVRSAHAGDLLSGLGLHGSARVGPPEARESPRGRGRE